MGTCLTRQLLYSEVSGCLVENPDCSYAYRLGFSYICRHPDHTKFNAFAAGILTKNEVDETYDALREKRRNEYLKHQGESVRNSLYLQPGFFNK